MLLLDKIEVLVACDIKTVIDELKYGTQVGCQSFAPSVASLWTVA